MQLEPNASGRRRDYLASYVLDGECWIYTGTINNRGYGTIRGRAAHRYFFQQLRGEIPVGLQLDHLCRTKACVNPDHLEPVTQSENVRRAVEANGRSAGDTCIRGHARSGSRCATCTRDLKRAERARRRALTGRDR